MTLKTHDFESGSQGLAATTANTGASLLTLNTGTAIFDAAGAFAGSNYGLKLTSNGASNVTVQFQPNASNLQMAVEFGYMCDSLPAANVTLATLRNSSGTAFRIFLYPTGEIKVDGATQTGQKVTGIFIQPNQKYRFAIVATVGTTTTNGVVSLRGFSGNSEIPLSSGYSSTTFDLGTAPISNLQVVTNSNSVWVDDVRFNDGSTTEIGPVPNNRVAASTVRPRNVLTNTGPWISVGGAATMHSALADESDTTFLQSTEAPAGDVLAVALDPVVAGTLVIKTRHKASAASPLITRVYELMQHETTLIATRTVTLPSTWTDYTFTLTSGENAAITDRAWLSLRWTDTSA